MKDKKDKKKHYYKYAISFLNGASDSYHKYTNYAKM